MILILSQVYHYYGQYSYVNVNQAVNPKNLQVVGNVLSLLTGWLAICKHPLPLKTKLLVTYPLTPNPP